MAVKFRSLFNEIQFFNSFFPMLIFIGVAGLSLFIVSYSMLMDLRKRAVTTADELSAFLEYPLYVVDDEQAVRIAKTFLSSGKVSGITLASLSNGLLLSESNGKASPRIPTITRAIERDGLPLGNITMTFSDEEIVRTLTGFVAIALIVVLTMILTHMAINRYFMIRRVRRPFETILAAINRVAEGNFETLVDPTPYRDINVLVDRINDMADKIHQKNLDQQRIQKELREGQLLLEDTFASLHDAVFVIDAANGQIINCNPAASTIFGYDREDLIGRKTDFLHVDDASLEKFRAYLYSAIEKEGRLILPEFRMRRKDGAVFPTEHNVMPLKNHQGESIGWISVVRDITERKQMMEEKIALHHQLLQLQKMEAVGTLAGGIAHDFNNILAGIIGYAELAAEDVPADDNRQHQYLSRILEASGRARNLVAQILNFSRQGKSAQIALALTPLVKECTKLLESVLPKTISLELRLGAAEDTVLADPTQMHQVIMNLGTNAYQAMRTNGGRLTFQLENVHLSNARSHLGGTIEPGTYIKLSVIDTGPGIPSHLRDRIFDPYFTTKAINEGTGLGLSVTQGIVNQHRGMIEVEATSATGATFAVFLPVTDEDLPRPAADGQPLMAGHGEHILAVDDEPFFLDVLEETLTGLGYQVTTSQNSREVLDRLRADPQAFDLLLTDQTMPELTGVQLAAEVRRITPRLPIILCTGYSETVTAETAANYGIARFLMKPVHRQELAQAVWDVLHPHKE